MVRQIRLEVWSHTPRALGNPILEPEEDRAASAALGCGTASLSVHKNPETVASVHAFGSFASWHLRAKGLGPNRLSDCSLPPTYTDQGRSTTRCRPSGNSATDLVPVRCPKGVIPTPFVADTDRYITYIQCSDREIALHVYHGLVAAFCR